MRAVDSWLEQYRAFWTTSLNNLKSFSFKLPPEEFIRVHRSYIVSLAHVDSIARNEIYVGKKIIPIGDSFKDDFYQIIEWNS